jgi:hypothetical protein
VDQRNELLAATGTGVALLGMLVLLTALAFAWPQPEALILVGLLNFVTLTRVALEFRLPVGHAVALACLTVSYVAGYHFLTGWPAELARPERAAWLVRQTFVGPCGAALAGLVTVLAATADRWRSRLPRDAEYYSAGAGLIGLLSIFLVAVPAIAEPVRATAVGSWYSAGCLLLGYRWRRPRLIQGGSIVLLATTVAALHWLRPGEFALWATVLAAEALLASALAGPWRPTALVGGLLALAGSFAGAAALQSGWPTITAVLLACAAFVQARQSQTRE